MRKPLALFAAVVMSSGIGVGAAMACPRPPSRPTCPDGRYASRWHPCTTTTTTTTTTAPPPTTEATTTTTTSVPNN